MEKGTLIEFRAQGGDRRLAVVDRPEGKKDWIVVDEAGHSHKLRTQKVEYVVDVGPYKPQDIANFLKEVKVYLDDSVLAIAWELLIEEGTSGITPPQLATLIYSQSTPTLCYAAHLLLSEDKMYFKRKGDHYEPRSTTQVEEIKHQIEVEKHKAREKEEFIAKLHRAIAKEKVEWNEGDRHKLDLLERLVLNPENVTRGAAEILEALSQGVNPQTALELLVKLGWWSEHENLFLRRSSYPLNFSKKVLEVTQRYLESPPPDKDQQQRLDLTHLKVYTIDDESTQEIDDGLSIEYLNGYKRIWVHIADPSHLLNPGDELDIEARRRSTSMYLPTGMVSMFPPELATGPMSLVQGRTCPALSFGIVLTEEGAVDQYTIHATHVKPTYRLTYEDVDEMLHLQIQAEPEILELADLAKKRQKWRKAQGAVNIHMPECNIKVKPNDEIVVELQENSLSRQLVAEMMILAGEVAGKYSQEHRLPVPFRSQPQPDLPSEEELLKLPAGPVRACALRRCMPKSEVGTTPARHASLGLDTYTQVTSPIRRYTDLLAHFQLKAYLRGEDLPFTLEQLQEILYGVVMSVQEASSVERQTDRYWSLEYLRRQRDQVWQVLVLRWLREDENLALVLLEDLGLELAHRFERSVNLGDQLQLQVTRSDPHRDEIRFREVLPHEVLISKEKHLNP